MRSNTLLSVVLILILTCFCVLIASCTPAQKSTESPNTISASPDGSAAGARQATVDALRSLPSGYTVPKVSYSSPDSARLDGWFDVNDYFSVLNHLSMRPGYALDYIYHNIGGEDAHPFFVRQEG